jgi:hypothetical protein
MTYHNDEPPERPRSEPEIIPPDRGGRQSNWRNSPWQGTVFSGARGTQRIYVTRVGPVGVALLMLAIAAILAIIVIVTFGLVLIWIPVLAVIVVAAALFRLLRGLSSR